MSRSERPASEAIEMDFEERSRGARISSGPVGEFLYFPRRTREWWMAPIVVVLLLVSVLLVMSSTAVAPLIYTLF